MSRQRINLQAGNSAPGVSRTLGIAFFCAASFVVGPIVHILLVELLVQGVNPNQVSDAMAGVAMIVAFLFGVFGWAFGGALCWLGTLLIADLSFEAKRNSFIACFFVAFQFTVVTVNVVVWLDT